MVIYKKQNTLTPDAILTNVSKAILPLPEELEINPRSRSAKMRFAQKI